MTSFRVPARVTMCTLVAGLLVLSAAAIDARPRFSHQGVSASCLAAVNGSLGIASLSSCSVPERRRIYGDLTTYERRMLWNEHLLSFVGPGSHLTADQEESLQTVISRLDEYFGPDGTAALERDDLTPARLTQEFGEPLARAMFATLGTDVRYGGHPAGQTHVVLDERGAVAGIDYRLPGLDPLQEVGSPPYCQCSQQSDWCCQGECGLGEDDCIVQSGCGTLWLHDCDGLCGSWETET